MYQNKFDKTYSKNAWEYYEHVAMLHKTIGEKKLHTHEENIFTQMMFTRASGMLQVVLSWTQVLHGWKQVHSALPQLIAVGWDTVDSSQLQLTPRLSNKWPGFYKYDCHAQLQVHVYASDQLQATGM